MQESSNVAKKTKKSSPKSESGGANVVRIRASGSSSSKATEATEAVVTAPVKVKAKAKTAKVEKPKATKVKSGRKSPRVLRAIGGYFKGAWVELRQVRWPNRRATWGLTAAVIAYSAFFVVFVLLLDAGFKYLFELILKK